MTLKEIYDFVVKEGINADPRGVQTVKKQLSRIKKTYQQLNKQAREEFDQERLLNPYSDTRILTGSTLQKVKTILVGIDIAGEELLLADKLNSAGSKIDLVMSHHPQGVGLAGLAEVMDIHSEILKDLGVAISVAESLMAERIAEVKRRVMPANHRRAVDIAEKLNLAFMCCHTAADNHVASYLQNLMDRSKPDTLGDILQILKGIPEYRQALKEKAGPRIISGGPKRQTGKIFVDMTGGTEGSKDIFQKLTQVGIGTIVAMHLSEEHFRRVKSERINVIIAGHIASDALGLNLLLDKLDKKQKLNIIECSGFKRTKRK
ncbi:MAG: NGG1p interacting factor NIF3 [Candidatus Omnitrophica bacterium]|nr:NGG1p interacting factor NIF3 [Candidatus Omnitrophota bacterium]